VKNGYSENDSTDLKSKNRSLEQPLDITEKVKIFFSINTKVTRIK